MRLFVTQPIHPAAEETLRTRFEVVVHRATSGASRSDLESAVESFDAILSMVSDRFDATLLERSRALKAISNFGVGIDNIDIAAANARGIAVYQLPDLVTNSTADHAFALLLALVRRIAEAQTFVREGRWTHYDPNQLLGEELTSKTFGILGFGRVGKAVAQRAKGFGLDVIWHSRSEQGDSTGRVSLPELLRRSDYLSVHVPLTEETRGMIDLATIRQMEQRPVLINTARGGVVNTNDLVTALEQGLLRGAAVDVTSPEPLPASHPLLHFKNCIVTPHIGTSTIECRRAMALKAAENLMSHFRDRV